MAAWKETEIIAILKHKEIKDMNYDEWLIEEEDEYADVDESMEDDLSEGPSSDAIPWNEEEEYDDGVIHAYNVNSVETDPTGWVDNLIAECEVENNNTGDRVFVSACSTDGYWAFCVSEESMIGSEDPAMVDALENYGTLDESRKSLYYEVFRRLMWTVENEL